MPQVTAWLYFRTHLITNLGEIWVDPCILNFPAFISLARKQGGKWE
jgi:hypothetical protein